ncbi:MAG: hypothetical protein HUJ54_08015 [Erysipelotrichaceae bacterium]|nr:hypothetical protein [Erysipelotrichaceae bacterium]
MTGFRQQTALAIFSGQQIFKILVLSRFFQAGSEPDFCGPVPAAISFILQTVSYEKDLLKSRDFIEKQEIFNQY